MTPPRLAPPPSPFPPVTPHPIPAGTVLHRNHSAEYRPGQFNPCQGQPSRFAPFRNTNGACVPSLYAATTQEAAAFETVFHDIEASAAFKTVRLDAVQGRAASRIAPRRALRLAGLFAPDLKAWRMERKDLIDTPKSTYAQTALWAKAIHAAHPEIEGLIWTSRQCDPAQSLILFGDRVAEGDFDALETREVATDPALLLALRGYGSRAGIVITT